MSKVTIERLASDILVAMYGSPATDQKDYRHNAMVAFNAARSLAEAVEFDNLQPKDGHEHNS